MDFTIVARQSDAFLLCEGWDPQKSKLETGLRRLRDQSSPLLRRLASNTRRAPNEAVRMTVIDSNIDENHKFYTSVGAGLIILSSFESSYPKKLALVFLEEIRKAFLEELLRQHGSNTLGDYTTFIETASTPYQYIRFDRVIQKKRIEFRDPRSHDSLRRLNQDLVEVSEIMQKNISDLILRGENLEEVSSRAADLKTKSQAFAYMARQLSFKAWLQTYLPFIIVGVLLLLLISWFIFF